MPLEIFKVHFRLAWSGCFPRLCSLCGAVCIFGLGGHTFCFLVVQSQLFVTGAGSRSDFLRCADFMAGLVLWTWLRDSACSDFVE